MDPCPKTAELCANKIHGNQRLLFSGCFWVTHDRLSKRGTTCSLILKTSIFQLKWTFHVSGKHNNTLSILTRFDIYGALLVPYTRAYCFILGMHTFSSLARLFFCLARLFFCLARLFFVGATFSSLARLFFSGATFFRWRDFFLFL